MKLKIYKQNKVETYEVTKVDYRGNKLIYIDKDGNEVIAQGINNNFTVESE